MASSYILRLIALCFASFFLVNAILGLLVRMCAAPLARAAGRLPAREAARLLFALRLAPAAVGLFAVLALCIPSYLWFEPQATPEDVGLFCSAAALLGLLVWCWSATRAARALLSSVRYRRACLRNNCFERLSDGTQSHIVHAPVALLAVSGIFRPQLFISRDVLDSLSSEQLSVALRHERVHCVSRHNLKRLLFLLVPDLLPFGRWFAAIESHWARFAEWAADDEATAGHPLHALTLASALVRVAQLGAEQGIPQEIPLGSCLTAAGRDLAARVDRLLHPEPLLQPEVRRIRTTLAVSAAIGCTCLVVAVSLLPAALPSIHRLLEDLVR